MGNQLYPAGKQQSDESVADEKLWLHVDWGGHTKSKRREAEHSVTSEVSEITRDTGHIGRYSRLYRRFFFYCI